MIKMFWFQTKKIKKSLKWLYKPGTQKVASMDEIEEPA